jgi:hypothetical protein
MTPAIGPTTRNRSLGGSLDEKKFQRKSPSRTKYPAGRQVGQGVVDGTEARQRHDAGTVRRSKISGRLSGVAFAGLNILKILPDACI